MHLVRLFWRMLRYRVAIMLVLFLLIGAAGAALVQNHLWQLGLAALALAAGYVSATTSNDLADQAIDAVNHAGHQGRPLVSGEATRPQMWQIFGATSVLAVALVVPLGRLAVGTMVLSVLVNIVYSLPPLRLSYRTWLAPLVLAVGYVGVPFILGVAATGGSLRALNWRLAAACYVLFVGRIVLKDFRDRAGDAKYGKPTLLLAHGKTVTLAASAVMVLLGTVLLWVAHPLTPTWLLLVPSALFGLVLIQALRLHRAHINAEQAIIGTGAKLGNGALIILLGLMFLQQSQASLQIKIAFASVMFAIFLYGYFQLIRSPATAVNAYRG